MYRICLISGDGIGGEVIPAARRVLESCDVPLEFIHAEAGWDCFQRTGSSVPKETLETARSCDATLAGAFTSPSSKVSGFFSAIRTLRCELDLFANLRPARSRPLPGSHQNIDLLLVRENTEGLYVAQERRYGDIAIADAVVSKTASRRIAKVALEQAQKRRKKLSIVHKANVLPVTTGLFLETVREEALSYPDIDCRDLIVDTAALKLVREPEGFDVLVTTNLFGDILSDLTAGLVGGLGLAASANLGERHALFEPVHGSAPDIAGKGIANPTAGILSAVLMLEHLGEEDTATRIEDAVNHVLQHGPWTPDLGGSATTTTLTEAIIQALESKPW